MSKVNTPQGTKRTGAKRGGAGAPKGLRHTPWIIFGIAAVLAVTLVVVFVPRSSGSPGARVGDHWHAQIAVSVCGQAITLPPSPGDVHSHGDGLIHVHPGGASSSGDNANLGRFFDSLNLTFNDDSISTPDGKLYKNGDRCSGSASDGRLSVLVNNQPIANARSYIIRDGDTIRATFQ